MVKGGQASTAIAQAESFSRSIQGFGTSESKPLTKRPKKKVTEPKVESITEQLELARETGRPFAGLEQIRDIQPSVKKSRPSDAGPSFKVKKSTEKLASSAKFRQQEREAREAGKVKGVSPEFASGAQIKRGDEVVVPTSLEGRAIRAQEKFQDRARIANLQQAERVEDISEAESGVEALQIAKERPTPTLGLPPFKKAGGKLTKERVRRAERRASTDAVIPSVAISSPARPIGRIPEDAEVAIVGGREVPIKPKKKQREPTVEEIQRPDATVPSAVTLDAETFGTIPGTEPAKPGVAEVPTVGKAEVPSVVIPSTGPGFVGGFPSVAAAILGRDRQTATGFLIGGPAPRDTIPFTTGTGIGSEVEVQSREGLLSDIQKDKERQEELEERTKPVEEPTTVFGAISQQVERIGEEGRDIREEEASPFERFLRGGAKETVRVGGEVIDIATAPKELATGEAVDLGTEKKPVTAVGETERGIVSGAIGVGQGVAGIFTGREQFEAAGESFEESFQSFQNVIDIAAEKPAETVGATAVAVPTTIFGAKGARLGASAAVRGARAVGKSVKEAAKTPKFKGKIGPESQFLRGQGKEVKSVIDPKTGKEVPFKNLSKKQKQQFIKEVKRRGFVREKAEQVKQQRKQKQSLEKARAEERGFDIPEGVRPPDSPDVVRARDLGIRRGTSGAGGAKPTGLKKKIKPGTGDEPVRETGGRTGAKTVLQKQKTSLVPSRTQLSQLRAADINKILSPKRTAKLTTRKAIKKGKKKSKTDQGGVTPPKGGSRTAPTGSGGTIPSAAAGAAGGTLIGQELTQEGGGQEFQRLLKRKSNIDDSLAQITNIGQETVQQQKKRTGIKKDRKQGQAVIPVVTPDDGQTTTQKTKQKQTTATGEPGKPKRKQPQGVAFRGRQPQRLTSRQLGIEGPPPLVFPDRPPFFGGGPRPRGSDSESDKKFFRVFTVSEEPFLETPAPVGTFSDAPFEFDERFEKFLVEAQEEKSPERKKKLKKRAKKLAKQPEERATFEFSV